MSIKQEIRQTFSLDRYYGGVGDLLHRLDVTWKGPELVAISDAAALADQIPPKNTPSAINFAYTAAMLAALHGMPNETYTIIKDSISPLLHVTPKTPMAIHDQLGKETDPAQQAMRNSRAIVDAATSLRLFLEKNDASAMESITMMYGTGTNLIDHAGKDRINGEKWLLAAPGIGITAGTTIAMLGGAIDVPPALLAEALIGGGTLAEVARLMFLSQELHADKEKIRQFFDKALPTVAPLSLSFLNLSNRRELRKADFPSAEAHDSLITRLYGDMIDNPQLPQVVSGTMQKLTLEQYESFANNVLIENGRLIPLSELMTRGMALEEAKNYREMNVRGRVPQNALPIITAENVNQVVGTVQTQDGATRNVTVQDKIRQEARVRLDAIKYLGRTDYSNSRVNAMAPYLQLFATFLDLQNVLRPDAEWEGTINNRTRRGSNDFVFHQQPDRNYAGWGIASSLIHEYYNVLPTQEYASKGFATEAAMHMFRTDEMYADGKIKMMNGLTKVPRSEMDGINSLNPYGRLVMTIATAAHQDAENTQVGEGWQKEVEDMAGKLIDRSFKNPEDLFVVLSLLSTQTHSVNAGQELINQWRETNTDPQFVNMMEQGVNNIAKTRQFVVEKLLGHLFKDRKHFMLDYDPDNNEHIMKGPYPHHLMYFALSWIIKEAPDMTKTITKQFDRLFTKSGMGGEPTDIGFGMVYATAYCKQQVKMDSAALGSDDPQRVQHNAAIMRSLENFLDGAGRHSLNYIKTPDYVRQNGIGRASRNAQLWSNVVSLLEPENAMKYCRQIQGLMRQELETGAVAAGDRRLLAKSSLVEQHTVYAEAIRYAIQRLEEHMNLPDDVDMYEGTYDELDEQAMVYLPFINELKATLTEYNNQVGKVLHQNNGNASYVVHENATA